MQDAITWGIVWAVLILMLISFAVNMGLALIMILIESGAWKWVIGGILGLITLLYIASTAVFPVLAVLGVIALLIYMGNGDARNPTMRRFNNWMESRRLGKRIV